jgi:hypothetical protein
MVVTKLLGHILRRTTLMLFNFKNLKCRLTLGKFKKYFNTSGKN